MAHDVTVDLGTYTISRYLDKKFALAVTVSMSLCLPKEHPSVQTAAELREKVTAGSLWISRAGSCIFELSVDFDDPPDDDLRENLEHMVVDAFETFPAWSALGLDLRRGYNRFHDLPGPNTPYPYSIQHAQQNSGLVAPDHVPCAYFSALFCRLSFGTNKNTVQGMQTEASALRKRKRIVTLRVSPRKLRRFAKRKTFEGQAAVARVSRARLVNPKISPPKLSRAAIDETEIFTLTPDLQEKRLESLTHIALSLLLGLRKRYSGVRVHGRAKSPTLLEMAPAVWNARYFQDVVSRVQLAPVISSALGSLFSTGSPGFRRKLQGQGFDTTEELHRHVQVLILKSTRASKINPRALRTSVRSPQIAGGAIDVDQNDEQVGPEVQESRHPARNQLVADHASSRAGAGDASALCTSDILQDDSLSCEMDPGVEKGALPHFRWHKNQQDFASSSRRLSGFRFSPEILAQSDTDLRFEEEQLHDAGRYAAEDNAQAMQQTYHQSPHHMGKGLRLYPDTTESSPRDEGYLDEDYLEAEKELAKVLASGNPSSEPQSSEGDYDDEFYLETEHQLAELLALRYNTDPEFQKSTGVDLMYVNDGSEADGERQPAEDILSCPSETPTNVDPDPMDMDLTDARETSEELYEDDAEGHGWRGENGWSELGDDLWTVSHCELHAQGPGQHTNTRTSSHGWHHDHELGR